MKSNSDIIIGGWIPFGGQLIVRSNYAANHINCQLIANTTAYGTLCSCLSLISHYCGKEVDSKTNYHVCHKFRMEQFVHFYCSKA